MLETAPNATKRYDVIVIGGGPAGLAAATELKRRGVAKVVVLDREPQTGGIPRHCGHSPFGMREFTRVLSGPRYATKLTEKARDVGVNFLTSTSVVEIRPGGQILVTSERGMEEMSASRIVIATGVRETPRSTRLISGTRPLGVVNTGSLQSMVYLKKRIPFKRPLIVGTELVSFSAIQTCRHAKIHPVAMIEEADRVTARWPCALFPWLMRVPLHLNTRLVRIEGDKRVRGVVLEDHKGDTRTMDCDGVILTGQFTPDVSLARSGHLDIDPASGGPVVDQFGRCSDLAFFAAGNILRPVETAGWSWNEGRQTGHWVADDLAGKLPYPDRQVHITVTSQIVRFAVPQKVHLPYQANGMQDLQLRFSRVAKGDLVVLDNKRVIWKKRMSVCPERRFLVPVENIIGGYESEHLDLSFIELK
jgi:NADPH-dependent 2,4-dienoyl-CoA reductase/sulfur reductase-like enzyme